MKNKLISLLAIFLLIFPFAACDAGEPTVSTGKLNEGSSAVTTTYDSASVSATENAIASRPAYEIIEGRTALHGATKG